jgi:hypothetical protein
MTSGEPEPETAWLESALPHRIVGLLDAPRSLAQLADADPPWG